MEVRGIEKGRRAISGIVLVSLALALSALLPAGASAAPPFFWQSSVGATTPGARGVAVDPGTGHVFVDDQNGFRIVELTAWGEFVRLWGWDVVASGPDDDTVPPEDQFEVCIPTSGDVCKIGIQGTGGTGQLNQAAGVAVDSSGNVYAAETGAPRRVQKFSPAGQFLLSFGGGVNQGGGTPANPGNVCTATHIANGDTCGAGTTGTGPSQFSGPTGSLKTVIAITPDGKVYVGDKERIQRFNTAGEYQGQINLPPEQVQQAAVDAAGFLYVSYEGSSNNAKENVRKLDPATGGELCRFQAGNPRAIAVAANGDVYVFDKSVAKILRFGPTCSGGLPPPSTPPVEEFGEGLDSASTGLAVSSACGIDGVDVLHSNDNPSFVRAYGPPPDPDLCPQPQVPPDILSQYATSVGTDSAAVEAQINPHFWEDTTYYVQYGTVDCAVGPCEQVLLPGAPLTSKVVNEPLAARADIGGLKPDTTYHFRFVAQSGGGGPTFGPDATFATYRTPEPDTACPNQGRRSGAAANLPDCRAYEMVSPIDKNGGETTAYFYEGFDAALKFDGLDKSTPGGGKLAYTATSAFAGAEGGAGYPEYIATRGEEGWATRSIDPPMRGGAANTIAFSTSQFKAFSEDLCQGWLISEAGGPLVPGPKEGFRNIYRRDNCATPPTYAWLQSSAPEPDPEERFPDLQGVSVDGSCAAFRVNDELTGDAPDDGSTKPYLWCEGGEVRLVSVLPNGAPFGGTATAGTETGGLGPGSDGALGEGHIDTVENALSEDGTRVYWSTSRELGSKLYLRVNADAAVSGSCTEAGKACTLQVSPNGEAASPDKAQFWTASPSGARAIFSVTAGLDQGNLYEYDFNAAEGNGARTLIAAKTLGVAGASDDATRVYFASEELCSGASPNSEGDVAQANKANLYLYEAGESCAAGQLEFVGTLAGEDVSLNAAFSFPSPLTAVPRHHIARASADGEQLLFVSAAQLSGYENVDAASGRPDGEVYLYDTGTDELLCVSCNPSGARPHGAELSKRSGSPPWTAAWIPGYQHQLYGRRLISAGGKRVFFNSVDALALRDANGAQDVYQWEAAGTGECKAASSSYSAQNGGCVDLLSSGQSSRDSEFVEASQSGEDVFIRTESKLVSSDPGSVDIYDARAGGGFAEPIPQPSCEGDSCQSVPPAPGLTTPASMAFQGPGDPIPGKGSCAKGKVRRKGRCVAKRPRHGHRRAAKQSGRASR